MKAKIATAAFITLFLALGGLNFYGDPAPKEPVEGYTVWIGWRLQEPVRTITPYSMPVRADYLAKSAQTIDKELPLVTTHTIVYDWNAKLRVVRRLDKETLEAMHSDL